MKALEIAKLTLDRLRGGVQPSIYDMSQLVKEVDRLVAERQELIAAKRSLTTELEAHPRWKDIAQTEHGELAQRCRDLEYTLKLLTPITVPEPFVVPGKIIRTW